MFAIIVRLTVFVVCLNFSFSLPAAQSKTSIWKEHIEFARGAVQQNDFTQAEANYALAFDDAEQAFKGTDLRYLETGYEAARLYIQLRKYPQAIAVASQVLVRMEKHKEGEQYAKARFLNLLGDAYLFANRLDEAEKAYQRGFDLFRGKIDERNPYAAESLKGLAAVAVSRKRNDEGLDLYQKALGIAKDAGMSHFRRNYDPRPAASLQSGIENEIGILYMSATNYVDARKWFASAQETIEKNFGKNSAELEPILKNTARTYELEKNYKEAENILIRSLFVDAKMRGGAISFAESSRRLASNLFAQENSAMDSVFGRLLSGGSKAPPPENFFDAVTHMANYFSEKDWPRTVVLMDKAIAVSEKQFGANNKYLPRFLAVAADLSTKHKSSADAERYLLKQIDAIKQNDGPTSVALADPCKSLAQHYAAAKSPDKADAFFDQQILVLQTAFGEKDSRVADAIEDKAAFLESSDRREQARDLRSRANQLRAASLLAPK